MRTYDVFKAIADDTRRKIFNMLMASNGLTINAISENFDISRQGVTKHLKLLAASGLVNIEPKGREKYCYPNTDALRRIRTWIDQYEHPARSIYSN
ncbi:metalloregulator ArsR/SmtB family transcription factor [Candidatus Kapabacteria bacterium]|nr:metalloregulator ArsR/SmtB family transcription factor [Candidatus Kapabacteria bacterium]